MQYILTKKNVETHQSSMTKTCIVYLELRQRKLLKKLVEIIATVEMQRWESLKQTKVEQL